MRRIDLRMAGVLTAVLLALSAGLAEAQATGSIVGRVTASDGSPLAGVSVSANGVGALTAADGSYRIQAISAGSHTLTVGLIGYATQSRGVVVQAGQSVTADFQLASKIDIAGKVSIGIGNVAARSIGKIEDGGTAYTIADLGSGKALNVVDGEHNVAQSAVVSAIREISSLRGRLGAFQKNTIGATIRSLGVSLENTTAAESTIRDADFATETAGLTRSQILVSSTTNVLALANSQPQNVLQLLG